MFFTQVSSENLFRPVHHRTHHRYFCRLWAHSLFVWKWQSMLLSSSLYLLTCSLLVYICLDFFLVVIHYKPLLFQERGHSIYRWKKSEEVQGPPKRNQGKWCLGCSSRAAWCEHWQPLPAGKGWWHGKLQVFLTILILMWSILFH